MPEFCTPVLADKKRVDEILSKGGFEGSLYSFAAIYSWALKYQTKIAFYKDAVLISGVSESLGLYFLYPVGHFDIRDVINVMRLEAKKYDSELKIIAEKRQVNELYSACPDEFICEDARDDWDYVYLAEDLAYLKGNRYHNKRNHISRLSKKYGNEAFSFEMINDSNISECMKIEEEWVKSKGDDFDIENVKISLLNMNELDLSGGLLRLNGKAIAFTVGESISEDTFVIHIEKALSGYDGAYQMINQLFAKTVCEKHKFINREEDMGIEGLRSSKLSYLPCKMVEKCLIIERK